MPCTTIMVGKKATNDNSTMIARTEDSHFDVKKMIVVEPKMQPRKYKTVLSHLEIDLPEEPMRYTSSPRVEKGKGLWPATGINSANVGMTATETLTTNPRVLSADPLVVFKKAKKRGEKDIPGGIGEEDMVLLVLPYVHSAREGAKRLGSLLEKYGTYENNGIAFNDENEVWWFSSIGGHHWMAVKLRDEEVVINPNQFLTDRFDLDDALGAQKEYMCSSDMREFIADNYLDMNQNGEFNPRNIFGSLRSMDHIYNTPRAWYMGRTLTPFSHKWDGPDAEYGPQSDDIPWSFIPDVKVTIEMVKYILSSTFEGTDYDPYGRDNEKKGMYRPIGVNRTAVTSICQIRSNVPDEIKGVEWICFGPTTFSAVLPVYTNVSKLPKYLSSVTADVSTENFYWTSRLLGALADPHYGSCMVDIEKYHDKMFAEGRRIIKEYDKKYCEKPSPALIEEANDALCEMAKAETQDILNKVVLTATEKMKNGFKRYGS